MTAAVDEPGRTSGLIKPRYGGTSLRVGAATMCDRSLPKKSPPSMCATCDFDWALQAPIEARHR